MITIQLPDTLADQLLQRAQEQHRSLEDVALDILHDALDDDFPSVEDVVAQIKATPLNPNNIVPPQGSLADVLRAPTPAEDFDLNEWKKQWAAAEAELRAINDADDIAEGRR